jgi:hypothetical protein
LADGYFRRAIKLQAGDEKDVLGNNTTNDGAVLLESLTDDDVGSFQQHLRGSIFEREVSDEARRRGI